MHQILEIRDGCATPEQLLKSYAFARYLKIYKHEFITDLASRSGRQEEEAKQKIEFLRNISPRDFLSILDEGEKPSYAVKEQDRALVRFLDGAFHHFRGSGYTRLIRLQNEVISGDDETPESVKDKVTLKAQILSDLILETRRKLLQHVHMDHQGVRRTHGLDASPNVTAGEVSGHYLNLPSDYCALASVPLTIAADIQTGVDYSTPANKRAHPFYQLSHNPFTNDHFEPEQWVSVPLQVGRWLIVAYLHKSRGSIEMEPGLLNLFPFARIDEIKAGRRPDGIFIFCDPQAKFSDLGFYIDEKNDLIVGMVPNFDELKYFGYAKKPILTLHNVLAIRSGEVPLHCGCTRYVLRFNPEGEPYIADMFVKADDMGRVVLKQSSDGSAQPIFYGTETGAFACLDGFSEKAKMQMAGREVGYNKDTGSNARQIVPVSADEEVLTGDLLDILLYMNNFTLIEPGKCSINFDMSVADAIEHFRLGERVAAGSTQTHRGDKESSYWANPFPLLKKTDGTVIHPDLYRQFSESESRFIGELQYLFDRGEILVGVAHSQLMAGVYKGNSDEEIARCGFSSRIRVEQEGPVRLAEDLIDLIKKFAREKRDKLGSDTKEISITVALVGDSRTGKSETAEKMEGVLGLQLI